MLCSRSVLPLLAFYILQEVISAAVLPSIFRNKREVSWLDQELLQHLLDGLDRGDLSVGDAGETSSRGRPSHPDSSADPLRRQHQARHQHQHKASEKRRKVAPLDSIGGFKMSSFQDQEDERDIY